MPASTGIDDSKFESHGLTPFQADAVRADFLAYNDRTADARALLDQILQGDPNNILAHETMGFLEFREQHIDAARNWYAQAVKLDSQSFLAHYYFAAISMNSAMNEMEQSQVETSLRASIKLNPNFAPSYDRLGALLAMRRSNLEEAHMMELNASQLDPGNFGYRLNAANILIQMGRGDDAVRVIKNAMHLATSPQETAMAENFLMHLQEYAKFQQQRPSSGEQMNSETSRVVSSGNVSQVDAASFTKRDEPIPTGPHRFLIGILSNVRCDTPSMDLDVTSGGKALGLHANNYFKVEYSALNVTLKGDLRPCTDLEGRSAKVEYVESLNKNAGAVIAIEIHK
ncbi:MAG: hypothetical protein WBV55_16635 [Candidatus Sulfotelmatobacter sp.]